MGERRYYATATGIWGHIKEPFHEVIPVQASLALPETGGFGTARVNRFEFRHIISCESVQSLVSGSYDKDSQSYDSTATVTITGLNILGVVTADQVVARIAASLPANATVPWITPLGSSFENLRIAGCPVEVELATDTFHKYGSIQDVRKAYDDSDGVFKKALDELTLAGRSEAAGFPLKYFPRLGKPGICRPGESMNFSLVRSVSGLPGELKPCGHIIFVRGFGYIRLAEINMTDWSRSISMVQVDLGSSPSGQAGAGGSSGGGPVGGGSGGW